MRLDKLLYQEGYGSRRRVKKLISSRQVSIDGSLATSSSLNVDPDFHQIVVAGHMISHSAERYYLLNKPAGVVSACKDNSHKTVIDLIAPEDRVSGLYPVGRLDRDTEGLLLLTSNGPLGFQLLHPKYHVSKTYYVEVNGPLGEDAVSFFAKGVSFHDGTLCQSASLAIISSTKVKSRANLTLSEGKFHQVKKMFLAYGVKVTYLKRIAFAGLRLTDIPVGSYRQLTLNEKTILKSYF